MTGRFIEGCDRRQQLFLPDCVDDYVGEDSPVRIVDVFVDELDDAQPGGPRPGSSSIIIQNNRYFGPLRRG